MVTHQEHLNGSDLTAIPYSISTRISSAQVSPSRPEGPYGKIARALNRSLKRLPASHMPNLKDPPNPITHRCSSTTTAVHTSCLRRSQRHSRSERPRGATGTRMFH